MFIGKYKIKVFAVVLAAIMVMAVLAGCGGGSKEAGGGTAQENGGKSSGEQVSSKPEELALPIVKEPLELTNWATLRKAATTMNDFNQKSCYQEIERLTGIHIKWQHPPTGQEKDQFNLMIAGGELPDLIWGGYFTNMQDAIDQKLIIPLNDLIAKYAPNFTKIMDKYPNIRKSVMTDSNQIFGFPFSQTFLQAAGTGPQGGFQIRKDWLDKFGVAYT